MALSVDMLQILIGIVEANKHHTPYAQNISQCEWKKASYLIYTAISRFTRDLAVLALSKLN